MIDPLFDEDWLHENNLDILFDLFEEEIESKVQVDHTGGSSALFGTSPITSYLFGTSTLDLFYLDNQQSQANSISNCINSGSGSGGTGANSGTTIQQQQQHLHHQQQQQQQQSFNNLAANPIGSPHKATINNSTSNSNKSTSTNHVTVSKLSKQAHGGGAQHQAGSYSTTSSISNAMRIKRGLKRGQSEGMSLLAKPFSANIRTSNRNGVDVNYSKQSQQRHQPRRDKVYLYNCQHHIHQLTGRAVLLEHAYAVRGH